MIEAGANGLFGGGPDSKFTLAKAEFVTTNRDINSLWLDFFTLYNLFEKLDIKSTRRKKIIFGSIRLSTFTMVERVLKKV